MSILFTHFGVTKHFSKSNDQGPHCTWHRTNRHPLKPVHLLVTARCLCTCCFNRKNNEHSLDNRLLNVSFYPAYLYLTSPTQLHGEQMACGQGHFAQKKNSQLLLDNLVFICPARMYGFCLWWMVELSKGWNLVTNCQSVNQEWIWLTSQTLTYRIWSMQWWYNL